MDEPIDSAEHRKRVYHEAGHAVAAILVGGRLDSIVADPRSLGDYATSAGRWPDEGCHAAWLLAGSLGSWIGEGQEGKPPWYEESARTWDGAKGDYGVLQRMALKRGQDEEWVVALEHRGKAIAWNLLDANRAAVVALAEALMKNGRIDGSTALAIVEPLLMLP